VADGREIIEQAYEILAQVSGKTEELKGSYSEDEQVELTEILAGADKWVGLCRRKVWLRGKEGTDLAQGCLDAANRLQSSLGQPADAIEAAADLSARAEALARIISTKSQVLT
jgi:hypothetical protein